ncbi:MAG TPA: YeeE/YedE family protein [Planctomycetota bacterium]
MDGKITPLRQGYGGHVAAGLVALAIVAAALFLHQAPVYGNVGTASLAILFGAGTGVALQRSRLCFTAAFRDLFLLRDRRAMLGVLTALAVGSAGYVLVFGARLPDPSQYLPPGAHIAPADWPTALGGLAFGLGMTLAGGCISGQLYRLGEGSLVAPVAIAAMLPGYWIAYQMWDVAYLKGYADGPVVWLPRHLGYAGALALQLGLLATAAGLLLWKCPALPPKPAATDLRGALRRVFVQGWPSWAGGLLLGAVAVAAYLRTSPLSTTSELNRISQKVAGVELIGLKDMPGCRPSAVPAALTPNALFVLALIAGSAMAALAAGEFKWRGGRPRTFALAAGGGVLMGFGAMLGLGCTIGTFLSGVMAFSLHGWLFAAALMAGAFLGVKILRWIA